MTVIDRFYCILNILYLYQLQFTKFYSHIVTERNIKDTKLHTDYALLLLQDLMASKKQRKPNESEIRKTRIEFNTFLNTSKYYDPLPIQSELTQTDFYLEISILFGRMGQHEKALEILVYKFGDNDKALEYCIQHSEGKLIIYTSG